MKHVTYTCQKQTQLYRVCYFPDLCFHKESYCKELIYNRNKDRNQLCTARTIKSDSVIRPKRSESVIRPVSVHSGKCSTKMTEQKMWTMLQNFSPVLFF